MKVSPAAISSEARFGPVNRSGQLSSVIPCVLLGPVWPPSGQGE
jgi:hypothetical protein